MSVLSPTVAFSLPDPYRITGEQYHEMIRNGIIKEDDKVELLEGMLVKKVTKHQPHRFATQRLRDLLPRLVPPGWYAEDQETLPTTDSEPEPDILVIRGDPRDFLTEGRHPGPEDMGLVVEVSDSSLSTDRGTKRRVYARANVEQYWIVNLIDRHVEVYTDPSGPCDAPSYAQQRDYSEADEVPAILDGTEVGRIRVNDLLV